jgi:hypothetical protein
LKILLGWGSSGWVREEGGVGWVGGWGGGAGVTVRPLHSPWPLPA